MTTSDARSVRRISVWAMPPSLQLSSAAPKKSIHAKSRAGEATGPIANATNRTPTHRRSTTQTAVPRVRRKLQSQTVQTLDVRENVPL